VNVLSDLEAYFNEIIFCVLIIFYIIYHNKKANIYTIRKSKKTHNIKVKISLCGGKNMRTLSEVEILSLTGVLKMESDGLAMQRAMESLITDEDLKRQSEASLLATEGRIKGIQQFMNENKVPVAKGVQ
jgi:hypothetical protein